MKSPIRTLATLALVAGLATTPVLTALPASAASLPEPVAQALTTALQDEYHAEAFYDAVMQKFGDCRPFSNIIKAEQTHQAELIALMKQYGVTVPANSQLGSAEIKAAVPATIAGACTIGVKAEIDNAALYDNDLLPAVSAYPDIVFVFEALRDASQQKHLPAFQRCAW